MSGLVELMASIVAGDPVTVTDATARLDRGDEQLLGRIQVYAGATALHVAAASHRADVVAQLLAAGADVHARDRRGATPLHAATAGGPETEPAATIAALLAAGAEVDARASGGVTPLHRATRNRVPGAVRALLEAGADPSLTNDRGSTALDLAQVTSGRPGSGSPAARSAAAEILALLRPPSS